MCCRQAALRNRVAGNAGLPGVARRLSGRAPRTGRALMDSRENSGSARWARPLTWPHRQRLPPGDGATLPGLRGVGDAGKQSAQLDGSRHSPPRSKAVRIAAASASVTMKHPGSMGFGSCPAGGCRTTDAPSRQPVWTPRFGSLPRSPDDAVEREAEEERGKLPKARGDAAAELLPE